MGQCGQRRQLAGRSIPQFAAIRPAGRRSCRYAKYSLGALAVLSRKGNDVINVTAVHMAGGIRHEHIAAVKWTNPQTSLGGSSTRAEMVKWIRDENGNAKVQGRDGSVAQIGVVNATPPYIRTHADGNWNDNLLTLPRY